MVTKNYHHKTSCSTLTLEYSSQVSVTHEIDESLLDLQNMTIDEMRSDFGNRIVVRALIGFLNDQPHTLHFRAPSTVWDHIKAAWLGCFVRKGLLSEPEYNHETIEIKDAFPFNREKFPKRLGDAVRIVTRYN